LILTGCSLFQGAPKVSLPGVTAQAPKDAGTPAVVTKSDAGVSVALPAGSEVVVVKESAVSATDKTPALPAKETTTIKPAGPTEYHQTESKTAASSGTVDTSIALKKVEVGESRPLLYASLACLVGAAFFIWAKYPTPAVCCGAGSVVLFMAWKLSDLPSWFYIVGLLAAGAGVFLYVGHEKGEKHAATNPTPTT